MMARASILWPEYMRNMCVSWHMRAPIFTHLKETEYTFPMCPLRRAVHLPVPESKRRTDPSLPPVARRWPSGLKAAHLMRGQRAGVKRTEGGCERIEFWV